jgi:hypothetical protein
LQKAQQPGDRKVRKNKGRNDPNEQWQQHFGVAKRFARLIERGDRQRRNAQQKGESCRCPPF